MPIIKSILDNDLYKLTMQKAVLGYRQNVPVEIVFNNRRPEGAFNAKFKDGFDRELDQMSGLNLSDEQAEWLEKSVPFLGTDYIEYLRNYRFNRDEISYDVHDGELALKGKGKWERVILWEVPLMALISELYFETCDTNWNSDASKQISNIRAKGYRLDNCARELSFADFGTRRRRSFATQELVVRELKNFPGFRGTSNVHLAHKYGVKPIGTLAHEFMMGISALEGLKHANRYSMQIWSRIFQGNLGTALPDTFGTDAFLEDFDGVLARLFDGVRHDSGDPYKFGDKIIAHYHKLQIKPETKTIVFSDGLDVDTAIKIYNYFKGRINVSFGIGTNFTNDFEGSKALNMVIKLAMCNGIPVVKLSDVLSKAIGDLDALRVARWTFFGTPLDMVA